MSFKVDGLRAAHEFLGEIETEVNKAREGANDVARHLTVYLDGIAHAIEKTRGYVEAEYGAAVLQDEDNEKRR